MKHQSWILFLAMFFVFTLFCFYGCPEKKSCTTCPPNIQKTVQLTLDYTECKEVWLKLSFTDANQPRGYALFRDGKQILSGTLITADTLLIDNSLVAGHDYTYIAQRLNGSSATDISTLLSVRTLDSTSHSIQWQVDTLGAMGVIRDVWVFDRNNAWAVGEIYLNDSTGRPDMSKPYNAAHWDGSKWTLKKITVNFRGYSITPPIQGIFAFSSNQIWLAGGLTIFGNGTNWTPYDVRLVTGFDTLDCEKGWGSNSSSMFFVGRRGSIAHFNGNSWTTMPSNTTVDLQDIWGIDATHIWATGTNVGDGHSVVLQCDGSNWTTIYDSNTQPYGFGCLWTNTTRFIYLDGGSGLYKMTLNNYNLGSEIKIGSTYLRSSIRGINNNDIFDVTAGGEAAHYNGSSWHYYLDIQAFNKSGAWFTRVYPTSNFVLIGGWYLTELNGFPVVIRGYR